MRAIALLAVICVLSYGVHCDIADIMVIKLKKYNPSLSSDQVSNALAMMKACMPYTQDPRQLSYVLSTAIGESNLRPIKEYRASSGTYLFDVQNKYWYTGYYGRGYVQLTWKDNYAKFGRQLGID